MNQNSYHVSRFEDMRDSIEIVSASGYEHAAAIAYRGGMSPQDGNLYVIRDGDLRVVEVDHEPEAGEEML